MKSDEPQEQTSESYHHGDLRAELLRVALEIIEERGVSKLSLRECARRAAVSHSAPYRHFAGRSALLLALACQGFRWLEQAAESAMEAHCDPRARLDAYGVAYVQFAVEHPHHHRLMFTTDLGSNAEYAETSAAVFALLQETAAAIEGTTEETVTEASLAFWSLVHGLSMLILDGRIMPDRIRTRVQVEALTRACFSHWRNS